VRDQRIIGRAALCIKDFSDGGFIEDISAEAVNSLRWKRDQLAMLNKSRRYRWRLCDLCLHF
jgi:hypothetical protein